MKENTDEPDDNDETFDTTRRGLLALAGLTGLSVVGNGRPSPNASFRNLTPENDALSIDGNLNMEGNNILNLNDITTSDDFSSWSTSGSGNGTIQLRDSTAQTWSMRAYEGDGDAPGPVKFQSPISGADEDDAGAVNPGSLEITKGAILDSMSVESWNVVDVTERGIQPGTDDDLGKFIKDDFDGGVNSTTIYVLPEGEYTWNTAVTVEKFDAFGIIGKPQARVKCRDPQMTHFLKLGSGAKDNADMFLSENITFDITMPQCAASSIQAAVDEYLYINNIKIIGEMDRDYGQVYSIHPTLLKNTGRGYVSVTMPDGGYYNPDQREQEHPMGISLERDHLGHIVIENSFIEGFINNGIYSAGHNGQVSVRNTQIKNCGAGMLRLGDGDFAYKCHLINDDAEDRDYSYAALWVAKARHAVANSIYIDAVQGTPSELIRVNEDTKHCQLTNIHVNSDDSQYICEFRGSGDDEGMIVCSNWTINDTGGSGTRAQLGRISRANVKIKDWEVRLNPPSDGKRHGLVIDAPWVDISGCTFYHGKGDDGLSLLLDDGADYIRLQNNDFKAGKLYQYSRASLKNGIVTGNRFRSGTSMSGERTGWTTSVNQGGL
ncbi:hypothetical protein [Haladaptatus sp. YSMS36]|uniref:hypothetical protein n=1 Tax=Haladaptatus sp. YSMS36 TaxID=3033384 RepID=UPI0023E80BDC|nr:hypothetical protein [Haladaptatus sp. YSMS36]